MSNPIQSSNVLKDPIKIALNAIPNVPSKSYL